mmetsp:Transcript_30236/g.100159  ORF Transcript_30236/g.100159 Transcript_30236/m.100159 type:complete len:358 (-) Transcript_30236:232-1305(-)
MLQSRAHLEDDELVARFGDRQQQLRNYEPLDKILVLEQRRRRPHGPRVPPPRHGHQRARRGEAHEALGVLQASDDIVHDFPIASPGSLRQHLKSNPPHSSRLILQAATHGIECRPSTPTALRPGRRQGAKCSNERLPHTCVAMLQLRSYNAQSIDVAVLHQALQGIHGPAPDDDVVVLQPQDDAIHKRRRRTRPNRLLSPRRPRRWPKRRRRGRPGGCRRPNRPVGSPRRSWRLLHTPLLAGERPTSRGGRPGAASSHALVGCPNGAAASTCHRFLDGFDIGATMVFSFGGRLGVHIGVHTGIHIDVNVGVHIGIHIGTGDGDVGFCARRGVRNSTCVGIRVGNCAWIRGIRVRGGQ